MVLYRTTGWFYIELSDCSVRTVGRGHGDGATCGMVTVAKKVDTGEVIAFCLTGANVDGSDSRQLFAC